MIQPKFIQKEKYDSTSLNYDDLLEEGIKLIEKYSGNQWSDYNYHDPGITFLEQICYAITDLGFKTNFSLEDILLADKDRFDLENSNLLIPPEKIFPTSPLTALDFRKVIINEVQSVKNAWVIPVKNDIIGLLGTFNVLIQFKDEIIETRKVKDEVAIIEAVLMNNRAIATDFNEIVVLKKDSITLSGTIHINSFVLGESVLAEIYYQIESKLNKELAFYEYEDILESNNFEDVFSGPEQKKSFIKEKEFQRKTNEIYQYEIKEIIRSIDGVIGLDDLVIYKNGIRMYEDTIQFDEDCYPSLNKEFKENKLSFYRNDTSYPIDIIILSQLYDSIALNSKSSYSKKFASKKTINSGRFSKKEIEYYHSIQNELPSIYGLKENEIASKEPLLRKSQVNQLKAFLLLIEQIMANYLSQLVHVRNLFSVDFKPEDLKTYFTQIPKDIAQIERVIGKNVNPFLEQLNKISESEKTVITRKNNIVDHLLSRFGETFDTSLITKLNSELYDDLTEYQLDLIALISKSNYSKSIINIGRNRIKGFNYKLASNLETNISGLKERLCLILDIKNHTTKSIIETILEGAEINRKEISYVQEVLKLSKKESTKVLAPEDRSTITESPNFQCDSHASLKELFLHAHKKKNYQIVKTKSNFAVLFNNPKQEKQSLIFESEDLNTCQEAVLKTLNRFRGFNLDCESFFLIENILLRSIVASNYQLIVFSKENDAILESYYQTEFNQLRDLRDDLYSSVIKQQNFSIEKEAKNKKYTIVLYDLFSTPIMKSQKQFSSKLIAEKEMERIIEYFKSKKSAKIAIDAFSEIGIVNSNKSKFPDDFKYSNHINFIFPDWPVRFQNNDFKSLINKSIQRFIPAHLSYHIFYLDFKNLDVFESVYLKWLHSRKIGNIEKIELESLQLIQLIMSYKPYAQ